MSEVDVHKLLRKLNTYSWTEFDEDELELLIRLVELHNLKKAGVPVKVIHVGTRTETD